MTQPATPDIFVGLDPRLIAFAALTAAAISVLMTLRQRNRERLEGHPSPLRLDTLVVDMLLGSVAGVGLALGVPELVQRLHTFTGVLLLSAVGGILGPRLFDLVNSDGMKIVVRGVARLIGGPLKEWADKYDGDDPPTTPPPAVPSGPAVNPATQEVQHDTP